MSADDSVFQEDFYVPVANVVKQDDDPKVPPHRRLPPGKEYPEAKLSTVLSSIAIACSTLGLMGLYFATQFFGSPESEEMPSMATAQRVVKLAVGQHQFQKNLSGVTKTKNGKQFKSSLEMLDSLKTGPVNQRLARAVAIGEMSDFSTACQALEQIHTEIKKHKYQLRSAENKLLESTERVLKWQRFLESTADLSRSEGSTLGDDIAQQPSTEDYDLLEKELHFAGEIASQWRLPATDPNRDKPAQSAAKNILYLAAIFLVGFLAIGTGVVIFIPMLYAFYSQKLRPKFSTTSQHYFLYLESFAVWIACFVGGQLVVPLFLVAFFSRETFSNSLFQFLYMVVLIYGSVLVSLAWLQWRHWDRKVWTKEIGFTSHGLISDLFCGVVTYVTTLPVIGVAMLVTVGLTHWVWGDYIAQNPFAVPPGPSHPIEESVTQSGWFLILKLYFTAAVTAPIVEEIVFRGMLYRYFRDRSSRSSRLASVLSSVLISGFIFAAIHPQGLLGIPALIGVSVALAMAREWRDGLVAPIAVHALHNGTLVTLLCLTM